MRPRYESQKDRDAEKAIIEAACLKMGRDYRKIPERYHLDFAIMNKGDDGIIAFAETKNRDNAHDLYPTFMIAMDKVMMARGIHQMFGATVVFFVGYKDGIYWLDPCEATCEIKIGGRKDRGDGDDIEPVCHFPINTMKKL